MITTENSIKLCLGILIILIVSILIIKRFMYFQPSSIFVPTRLSYEVIQHNHLYGWFLKGSLEKVILFCHGNAGNISHRETKLSAMHNMGYSVMIFDYSGFGKSTGVPSEQQCYDDASSMVGLLLNSFKPSQIVAYGESLGAPVAAYIARRYSLPTVILESPLPSIKSYIRNSFPLFSCFSYFFKEFDTASYINGYAGETLVIHSINDEIISYDTTQSLRDNATAVITVDGSHNFPRIPWDKVHAFIG